MASAALAAFRSALGENASDAEGNAISPEAAAPNENTRFEADASPAPDLALETDSPYETDSPFGADTASEDALAEAKVLERDSGASAVDDNLTSDGGDISGEPPIDDGSPVDTARALGESAPVSTFADFAPNDAFEPAPSRGGRRLDRFLKRRHKATDASVLTSTEPGVNLAGLTALERELLDSAVISGISADYGTRHGLPESAVGYPDGVIHARDSAEDSADPEPAEPEAAEPEAAAPEAAEPDAAEPDAAEPDAAEPEAAAPEAAAPEAADTKWPIDEWAPDESAWAAFAVDDTPPAFAARADVPSTAAADSETDDLVLDSARLAPLTLDPQTDALDENEPAAVGGAADDGELAEGGSHQPTHGRHRPPWWLSPKVLAGATAGVLTASIVGAIAVHPGGHPRLETVKVQGTRGPSLFPGSTADPATVPPNNAQLIIIPPGSTVSSVPPGVPTSPPSSSPPGPSPSSVSPGSSSPTPSNRPHASGGYSTPPRAIPPRALPPPSNTTTTTTTQPTTTSSTSSTIVCIIGICH